jgi:hypothetical protein
MITTSGHEDVVFAPLRSDGAGCFGVGRPVGRLWDPARTSPGVFRGHFDFIHWWPTCRWSHSHRWQDRMIKRVSADSKSTYSGHNQEVLAVWPSTRMVAVVPAGTARSAVDHNATPARREGTRAQCISSPSAATA